jgi:cystathionine beta-lyase
MARILARDVTQQRRDRTSVKWTLWGPDVLPLWVAEMDAAPCPAVVEAVSSAMARGDTGYPDGLAYPAAYRRYAADSWGWDVPLDAARTCSDVMGGIDAILRVTTAPCDAVVVSPPVYDNFFNHIAAEGRRRIDAPLTPAGRLDPDALRSAFAAAIAGGGRAAYLLCNPHNPTGTVPSRAELETLAELADEFGVTVVSDEIHSPLVYAGGPGFVPWLTVSERGFAVFSAGKAWNLAAFKAAVLVAGEQSREDLNRIPLVVSYGMGHMGSIAHVAALDAGRGWLAEVLRELDDSRALLARLVADHLPAVSVRVPDATYLAWLDFRATDLGEDPATAVRQRAGVALSSGPHYGAVAGRGFARLNFATGPEILAEAVTRIASAAGRAIG